MFRGYSADKFYILSFYNNRIMGCKQKENNIIKNTEPKDNYSKKNNITNIRLNNIISLREEKNENDNKYRYMKYKVKRERYEDI